MQQVKPQLQKWEATVRSSKLQGVKPDQAWSLVGDYYGIHKILPSITSASQKVDGGLRKITFSINGSPQTHWLKDRLVSMDQTGKVRSYTYEILENNCGFGKMTSTLKVVPVGEDGCMVEWSAITGQPIQGWTKSELDTHMQAMATEAAKTIEKAFRASTK